MQVLQFLRERQKAIIAFAQRKQSASVAFAQKTESDVADPLKIRQVQRNRSNHQQFLRPNTSNTDEVNDFLQV
jgi:hypothetical protein